MLKDCFKIFTNGLWEENAIFGLALGLCPALAVTTNASNGLGMGMALLFVLTMSTFFLSLMRNYISDRVRVPFFLAVVAGFVTITELVMKAYTPELSKALGVFVPLIVVNCTVLGRVEVFASKNPPLKALADGLGMGIGFTIALIIMGGIRELLGNGTFFDQPVITALFSTYKPILLMILPPGGFLLTGILMGLIAWYKQSKVKSEIARAKGANREDMVPSEIPDELSHAALVDKP